MHNFFFIPTKFTSLQMIISSFIANLTELILFARMIKLRCTLDSEIKIPARPIEVP